MTETTPTMTVDEAASKALELVQRFASVEDPHEQSAENPWQDPQSMLDKLIHARHDLMQAWNTGQPAPSTDKSSTKDDDKDKDFRALYMDMITAAFADVLEELRSSDTEILNVDVLVDCLQSGLELLNQEDKDILFRGMEDDDDEEDEDMDQGEEMLTPHEAHRRKLGFAL
jgi:hypothetical protein